MKLFLAPALRWRALRKLQGEVDSVLKWLYRIGEAVDMPTHAYAAGWVAWLPTRIVWVEAKVGRQAAHPARPIDPGRLNGGSIAVRKKD
jgi:hypothetical protein